MKNYTYILFSSRTILKTYFFSIFFIYSACDVSVDRILKLINKISFALYKNNKIWFAPTDLYRP